MNPTRRGMSGWTRLFVLRRLHQAGLAEVVAVDGERDGQGHEGGTAEERPEQQTPVMKAFATEDAEADDWRGQTP